MNSKAIVKILIPLVLLTLVTSCLLRQESNTEASRDWKLVYNCSFKKPEDIKNWTIFGKNWKIKNGLLTFSKAGSLFYNRDIFGCQRIELEAKSDAATPCDLSPIIHSDGKTVTSGYLLQFGGMHNTISRGQRLGEFFAYTRKVLIKPGKMHKIVGEFDGKDVKLFVDGKLAYKYRERKIALIGKHHRRVGFYIYGQGSIKNIKIYSKPFVPPSDTKLELPQKLILAQAKNADMNAWGGVVKLVQDNGKACFQMDSMGLAKVPGIISIDPTKTYELSGWFKSGNPQQLSRVLLDVHYLNGNMENLGPMSVMPYSDVSKLTKNAAVGMRKLYVAKVKSWGEAMKLRKKLSLSSAIAFNAKADQSDLCNIETCMIKDITEYGKEYVITLYKPIDKFYPSGTMVRLHRYLDYARVFDDRIPTSWKKLSLKLSAKALLPGLRGQSERLWPKAQFARLIIMHHYNKFPKKLPPGEKPPVLLFNNILLVPISKATCKENKTVPAKKNGSELLTATKEYLPQFK